MVLKSILNYQNLFSPTSFTANLFSYTCLVSRYILICRETPGKIYCLNFLGIFFFSKLI